MGWYAAWTLLSVNDSEISKWPDPLEAPDGDWFPSPLHETRRTRHRMWKLFNFLYLLFSSILNHYSFHNAFLLCHEDIYCLGLWCPGLMGNCKQLCRIWENSIKQHRVKRTCTAPSLGSYILLPIQLMQLVKGDLIQLKHSIWAEISISFTM